MLASPTDLIVPGFVFEKRLATLRRRRPTCRCDRACSLASTWPACACNRWRLAPWQRRAPLRQLLIDFGRFDLCQQLIGLHLIAQIDEPARDVAAGARVDHRLFERLNAGGQLDQSDRSRTSLGGANRQSNGAGSRRRRPPDAPDRLARLFSAYAAKKTPPSTATPTMPSVSARPRESRAGGGKAKPRSALGVSVGRASCGPDGLRLFAWSRFLQHDFNGRLLGAATNTLQERKTASKMWRKAGHQSRRDRAARSARHPRPSRATSATCR